MSLLLGLDIGTTSTTGVLVTPSGQTLGMASRPVELSSPNPGWTEEDPDEWWINACAITSQLLETSGVRPESVEAVGVTGMVPAIVLLDDDCTLLRPSIQQSDARALREVEEMSAEIDPAVFLGRTGNGINQQLAAPTLRWLQRHEPGLFGRIGTVFGSYDYIIWRLTGRRSTDLNWALEAGFMGLSERELSDELIAIAGIDRTALPNPHAVDETVGTVSRSAAMATGLVAGTPVIAGCADHVASAFMAGATRPGNLVLKFGGAGDILLSAANPFPDRRLFLDYHIVPDLFMPNGCMASSGSVLNWIAREFAGGKPGDTSVHAGLDARAGAVPPGANGLILLPYFVGEKTPIHDPAARGALIGLDLSHSLADVWRAALEAVCMGFRHHTSVMADIGYPIDRIVACDGGTSSSFWMQIAADVLQREIQITADDPGSSLGAAYVAGHGVGLIEGWDETDRFLGHKRAIEPTAANAAIYDEMYGYYLEVYQRLGPLYTTMHRSG